MGVHRLYDIRSLETSWGLGTVGGGGMVKRKRDSPRVFIKYISICSRSGIDDVKICPTKLISWYNNTIDFTFCALLIERIQGRIHCVIKTL